MIKIRDQNCLSRKKRMNKSSRLTYPLKSHSNTNKKHQHFLKSYLTIFLVERKKNLHFVKMKRNGGNNESVQN